MPTCRVATFNLNNLFSRFNFQAVVDALPPGQAGVSSSIEFDLSDPTSTRFRTYKGRLVKGKTAAARATVAQRIKDFDADVVAVQEVEDVDTLQRFVSTELEGLGYHWVVLVEGNDPRLIDVGILSRLPVGAVTSWRHTPDPATPGSTVFGRDLLEVEILNRSRTKRLLTVYNTHLKSHYVPFDVADPVAAAESANRLRERQARAVVDIVNARQRPNSAYVVAGDMNDPPTSTPLAPLAAAGLVDGLATAQPDRPAPNDDPPAPTAPWTHRFKESHQPARYELFDHVWLSPTLAGKATSAGIGRRSKLGGDGSDHDPAWVDLAL
jgi:endonuclease/exonuclease/phosphatase family metal-dependent hydrolase